MEEIKKRVLVVDLNNIWNKYLFARKGYFDSAMHSVLELFKSIYKAKEFAKVYIALDGKPTERYEIYKDYKCNRKCNPDKYIPLKVLVSVLSQYFEVVGGKTLEGDDVVASIARKLTNKYVPYIFSNDKDFIQLMQYGIKIVTKFKYGYIDEVLTEEKALAKFKNTKGEPLEGLENILPYRVFKGDSSDGIHSACCGMKDKDIRNIVYNCWEHVDDFTEDTLNLIIERVDNSALRKVLKENKDNIMRNYKLMNLTHYSEDFFKTIKRFNYKLDVEGLKKYTIKEDKYRW